MQDLRIPHIDGHMVDHTVGIGIEQEISRLGIRKTCNRRTAVDLLAGRPGQADADRIFEDLLDEAGAVQASRQAGPAVHIGDTQELFAVGENLLPGLGVPGDGTPGHRGFEIAPLRGVPHADIAARIVDGDLIPAVFLPEPGLQGGGAKLCPDRILLPGSRPDVQPVRADLHHLIAILMLIHLFCLYILIVNRS